MTVRNKSTVVIHEASRGQIVRSVYVDGDIVGSPNVSGTIGLVSVKKGSTNKVYIYNLTNGSLIKINCV
jgi:hypothetical protein